MKRLFLGMADSYTWKDIWRHTFAVGRQQDHFDLIDYLDKRYGGEEVILCKNGRSALCLALKAYFEPGDKVIVNGFTCYAVYEAIKSAELEPVFVDISKENLNFDIDTLEELRTNRFRVIDDEKEIAKKSSDDEKKQSKQKDDWSLVRGIIVQNSLGNPVDIEAIEKFAKKHDLKIIEDLAHCAGVQYSNGQECGTVGIASAFSFGKDKSIDTVSGGAVVLREPSIHRVNSPSLAPKISDHLRARFYPLFGGMCRGLMKIRLGGVLMRSLIKIHWVERSADNSLDLKRKPSNFEAKLALKQLKKLKQSGEPPLREFRLVKKRDKVLKELEKTGFYFSGFWYEKPVSPERYYKKVRFPEKDCPNSVYVAKHIINLPSHRNKRELLPAYNIIKKYQLSEEGEENE